MNTLQTANPQPRSFPARGREALDVAPVAEAGS